MTDTATQAAPPFSGRLTGRARWALDAASEGFERLLGPDGYARCPEHGVDHTGKTARAIVINCALHAAGGEARYLDRAVRIAGLVTGRLGQDPDAGGAWIFFPGLHDPANISTNIIDNGECVDALATLLRHAGDQLDQIDRSRFEDAIRRCCDSYLVANVATKPVINQRLWGAMGLASAAAYFDEPRWVKAVHAAVERSLGELRADGSLPYVTDADDLGEHAGSADLTVYYHGRCMAFARFALQAIGGTARHEADLRRAADFLVTVLRPDGVKPLGLEGKRWFWDADSESGSAAYDAYALAADGRPELLDLAGRVAARAEQSVGSDGLVGATADAPSFVCRVFHAADLAWLARAHDAGALDDLPANPAIGQRGAPVVCGPSGVVRLEAQRSCAILRANKQPASGLVGGRIGGGGLVYVGNVDGTWRNELGFVPEPGVPEATWIVEPGAATRGRTTASLTPSGADRRFRLHIARTHWRAGRRAYALRMLWRFLGPPAAAAERRWQSNHAIEADVETSGDGVIVRSGLAHMSGELLAGAHTERRYLLDRIELSIDDLLRADRAITGLAYRIPAAAGTIAIDAEAGWRLDGNYIRFQPLEAGASARLRYRI